MRGRPRIRTLGSIKTQSITRPLRLARIVSSCLAAGLLTLVSRADRVVILDVAQTAGMDAREIDRSFPGATTVDAVHRSVLLRFPGSAETIAALLTAGAEIAKAEIVFDYAGHELAPKGYTVRGTYRKKWEEDPPRWHLLGAALRQPWDADDADSAPTFNAFRNGTGYWARFGARDERNDRHPAVFGPTELSGHSKEGRMDITPVMLDAAYGDDPGTRLRNFEEQGILLRKWETYDKRYDDWTSYEWAVGTGGHAISFAAPRLVITLRDAAPHEVKLPQSRDLAELPPSGQPTAVLPDDKEIRRIAERHRFKQPSWMPGWQWQRVSELRAIGGRTLDNRVKLIESGEPEDYHKLIDEILADVPRYWKGWAVQDDLILWHLYRDALPPHVREHMMAYWEGWLHRDTPREEMTMPQGNEKLQRQKEILDWRGDSSFFRGQFTQRVSTMNFNHTANMGALLGGTLIGSEQAVRDGRDGLENMLLRFWSYKDGTSQEMLDHYYFSITLSAQKMFADFGPDRLDRLMGEMIRDRAVELLAGAYHPHLRRAVSASGRVRMSNVLGFEQEGGYGVLHTLSPKGVLFHTDRTIDEKQRDMHLFGYDFPPARVAIQTLVRPWGPEWYKHVVDDKPIPYQITAAETTRGMFRNPPLWRRVYLGRHYGLASQDIKGGSVDVMAQWNPGNERATDAELLGTLTVRHNINEPEMAWTQGGMMPAVGTTLTFQDRNRAIVATKPTGDDARMAAGLKRLEQEGIHTLSSNIAIWKFHEDMDWKLAVDGEPVKELPARLKAGQVITLRDGDVFIGVIPLPATDLGRDEEIVIEKGKPMLLGESRNKNVRIAPSLMIRSFNLRQDQPVEHGGELWQRMMNEAHGGFVFEISDAAEFPSYADFQRHMMENSVESTHSPEDHSLDIRYRSGDDLMEMGISTSFPQSDPAFIVDPGKQREAIRYRRINGGDPYLPEGIDRDTTLTMQGTTGRLEKNGAVLLLEEGRKGYIQTEPVSGTFTGYNPFPDLTPFALTAPGDMEIRSDGNLGLARISVRPAQNKIWVDFAWKDGQQGAEDSARRLLVSGTDCPPSVILNGAPIADPPLIEVDGKAVYAIPLAP